MDRKEYLCLNLLDDFLRIDASKIVYIKTVNHNACIVLCNKTQETVPLDIFQVRTAIINSLKELAAAFVYVEDFIVNLNYVHRIDAANQKLIMGDGETFSYQLTLSKESLSKLKDKCVSFLEQQNSTKYAHEEEPVIEQYVSEPDFSPINEHEYIDLGLSVKWATCNVGAPEPFYEGDFYAWGETVTKSEYTKANSFTYNSPIGNIAANPKYDVARANWGGKWRLPTMEEINELIKRCKWEWATRDGHKGYNVTGPNGNSIFLPATGWCDGSMVYSEGSHGSYWSATPSDSNASRAFSLSFDSDGLFFIGDSDGSNVNGVYIGGYWGDRNSGYSVRPVLE